VVFILEVFDGDANDVFGRVRFGRGHCENDGEGVEKKIAERVGLPPVAELFRLEGFQEPWELMCAQLVVGSLFLFRWFFTSFVRSLRYFVRFFPRTDKLFLSFL